MSQPDPYRGITRNTDLKHYLIPERQRPAWFGGTLIAIGLIAVVSWTSQRDEAARQPDSGDRRLAQLIATTHCAAPDVPLEKLVLSIGTQADGKAPSIACVYISSALGTVPNLRYARPLVIAEAP